MSKAADGWKDYAKGVKALKAAPKKVATKKPTAVSANAKQRATTHTVEALLKSVTSKPAHDWNAQLGKKLERDMRAGEIVIDARIDLHGMTQTEAYTALAKFIATQVKRGARNLLVITGRGGVIKGGVLRSNLRGWLENLPDAAHILRLTQAAVAHGGQGAFYVVLRRARP